MEESCGDNLFAVHVLDEKNYIKEVTVNWCLYSVYH